MSQFDSNWSESEMHDLFHDLKAARVRKGRTPKAAVAERPYVATPEWSELRTAIVKALEPYPDACAAVVRALAAKYGVSLKRTR